MKLSHSNLIQLGILLGYKGLNDGLCHGFSCMWMQAVLARDEATFYSRLELISTYKHDLSIVIELIKLISTYKHDFPRLVNDIKQSQQKPLISRTQRDVELLSILNLYEGIAMYLRPFKYRNYFPDSRYCNQNEVPNVFILVKPIALEQDELNILLDKEYAFTKQSLTQFFKDIKAQLNGIDDPIPIFLTSAKHSVCLKHDNHKACWHYVDTNDFQRYTTDAAYFRKLDTETLVDSVFTSFMTDNYAIFNTYIISLNKNIELKDTLNQFNLNYPVGHKQISYRNRDGSNLLHIACQNGNNKLVQELLNSDIAIDPNVGIDTGSCPLYIASQNGHLKIVQELLKYRIKVDPNKAGFLGITPLYTACSNGHLDVIKELLKPEYKTEVNKADNDGETPLFMACSNGHLDVIKELLKPEYKTEVNKADILGLTPLMKACSRNHLDVIKELLKPEYKTEVNKADTLGLTPLIFACADNHLDVVKELLKPEYKTEVNKADILGLTPLMKACSRNHLDVVKELLKPEYKTEVNKAAFYVVTPLISACLDGHVNLVKELLNPKCHTPMNNTNMEVIILFIIAYWFGHTQIIKELSDSLNFIESPQRPDSIELDILMSKNMIIAVCLMAVALGTKDSVGFALLCWAIGMVCWGLETVNTASKYVRVGFFKSPVLDENPGSTSEQTDQLRNFI